SRERLVNRAAPKATPSTRPCSRPIEVTSIATPCAPAASSWASERCSATASGVVLSPASNFPGSLLPGRAGKPVPRVPITAVRAPHTPHAWAIQWLHEVLPLVPVTPIVHSFAEGRPYTSCARGPATPRRFPTPMLGTRQAPFH